jgi:nucleoside-diphosphate-sugar epimerase
MANRVVSILGCGWLGKPLGSALVNAGYSVMGSTTTHEKVPALREAGINAVVFDVDQLHAERAAKPFFHTDVLVISLPHGVRSGKAEEYGSRIRAVVKAACQSNAGAIILISTTSVYPNLNRVVTEEDADARNPVVHAENMVRESGIPNTILRFAGLSGPGRHPGRFLAGKRDVSGGDAPVNLIHLDDCIAVILRVIQNNVWNEVLNVCSDDHPTRKTFYTRSAIALGLQPPVFVEGGEADYKIVSNDRVKAVLNYQFIHRFI